MRQKGWIILSLLAMVFALGIWTNDAAGQEPPPEDELDMMLNMGMGMGGPPDLPPRAGFMRERGPGTGGPPGERGGPFKKKAMERIKKEDPERYKRIEKIKGLAMEYREADDEKKKQQIEKELRPLVEKELRAQQDENKKRIEKLEKKIKHMKKVLKQREENWDQVVDHTVKEVTGQNDYLHVLPGGPRR